LIEYLASIKRKFLIRLILPWLQPGLCAAQKLVNRFNGERSLQAVFMRSVKPLKRLTGIRCEPETPS